MTAPADPTTADRAAGNLAALAALTGDDGTLTLPLAPLRVTVPDGRRAVTFSMVDGHASGTRLPLTVRCVLHADDGDHPGTVDTSGTATRRPLRHARPFAVIAAAVEAAGLSDFDLPQMAAWLTALRTRERIRDLAATLTDDGALTNLIAHAAPGSPAATLAPDWSGTLPQLADTVARLPVPSATDARAGRPGTVA